MRSTDDRTMSDWSGLTLASTPTHVACLSYHVNDVQPEVEQRRYVVMKYFPTGNGDVTVTSRSGSQSPLTSPDDTLSRTYQSPDGSTRTIVVSAKRTVLPSSGSQNGGGPAVGEVTAIQNEVFVESKTPTSTVSQSEVETEVQQLLRRIRRERLAKIGAELANSEPGSDDVSRSRLDSSTSSTSSLRSWTTRDNLRTSRESTDSGIASCVHGDTVTSQVVHPIAKMAVLDSKRWRTDGETETGSERRRRRDGQMTHLERFLLKFERGPIPTSAVRRPTAVPGDPVWENLAYEILESELGENAMLAKLEKQMKIFQEGVKKGGMLQSIPLAFHNWKIKSMFEKRAKETRSRGLHQNEVGATGYGVILKNDRIPENEFFVPDRMFEIRAKHSSFPVYQDDQKAAWRSLSLKFQDHDFESPLDLVLQTGRTSPFFNVQSLEDFYNAYDKGPATVKKYLSSLPVYLETIIEGLRKGIGSYISVHYYSHVTYDFKAKDGVRRLARFRVLAPDGPGDRGRLKPDEQRRLWYKLLLNEDKDPERRSYLAPEWRNRIQDSGVTYVLQIQIREWSEGDTYSLYNASRAWDGQDTPWLDLAVIRLLSVLQDDILNMTSFCVGNLPDSTLGFPEATSTSDFNVVPYVYKEAYKCYFNILPHEPRPLPPGERVEYLMHFVTSDHPKAGIDSGRGSDCDVYISLIGSDARTPYLRLDRKKNDFATGSRTTFSVQQKYIGDVLCMKIYKDKKGPDSDWLLNYVIVSTPYNNNCYLLPCFSWFTDQMPLHQLRDGTATLLDKEANYYMRRQRQAVVTQCQLSYLWYDQVLDQRYADLPGYVEANDDVGRIPLDLQADHGQKLLNEWTDLLREKGNFYNKFRHSISPRTSRSKDVEEACKKEVAEEVPKSEDRDMLQYIMKHWKTDSEFSRQMLNGVMPHKLRQLKEMPSSFPVTDEMLDGLLEGSTLDHELKDGRLYMISYPELEQFAAVEDPETAETIETETPSGRSSGTPSTTTRKAEKNDKEEKYGTKYLCAPMVLFHAKNGSLNPIAIQLTQKPSANPVIYTPLDKDGEYSNWQIAKMWVRVADANLHHFHRILNVHLLLEPVALAVARNLPPVHPVRKLLYPYVRDLMTVNAVYRKCVLSEDGLLAEVLAVGSRGTDLLRRMTAEFRGFWSLNPNELFSDNGTTDLAAAYHSRDDCLAMWDAIRDFVVDIICVHYDDDECVEGDVELAAFVNDLNANGFQGRTDLPERFSTVEQLVLFCGTVVYQATVQYTAYTRGMLDVYGFCLNAPPCMMRPPCLVKEPNGYTSEYVHSLLPPGDLQESYINALLIMTYGFKEPKVTLGQYPEGVFTEEKAVIAIKSFQKQLSEISAQISQRKSELRDCNYEYLLPENIPVGIRA